MPRNTKNSTWDLLTNMMYYPVKTGMVMYDSECGHNNVKVINKQTRSADEIVTTMYFCLDCRTNITTT